MLNLRLKFVIAIVLLVFLPVVIMGVAFYFTFSDMIEKKTSSYYQLSLQDTDSKLKYALNEINTVTDLAITQTAIQQLIKHPPHIITSEMAQEINSYIMIHPQITSFSVYTHDSLVYQTSSSPAQLKVAQLKSMPWYSKMLELNGRPLWIGPGENSIDSTYSTMLLVRVIKDYHSLENIGTLIVSVKPDILEQVFWEAAMQKEGNVLLLNQDGVVAYSKTGEKLGDELKLPFMEREQGQKDYFIENVEGERAFLTYMPSFNEGWTMVAMTPLSQLQEESRKIRNITLAIVMFLLLTAFLFEKYFVSKLIQTIVKTVKGLKDVQSGIFREIMVRRQAKDESGMLVIGFNRMSRQIRELLLQVETEQQRKKEAELQALVAQINPHFIYNSLESINSMAVLQGNKEISRMVISLGKLLRISISENQELIPISMEIEHVQHYMNIQKMRFEDKFDFVVHLPNELKTLLTQKLIVQPIVENALYHGIEAMEGVGRIIVSVFEDNGYVYIEVADNGPGFDLGELEQIWSNDQVQQKKYKESGVGLKNVHERLTIRFGSPYGLMICSSPGEGTTIRIRIPRLVDEDDAWVLDRRGVNL